MVWKLDVTLVVVPQSETRVFIKEDPVGIWGFWNRIIIVLTHFVLVSWIEQQLPFLENFVEPRLWAVLVKLVFAHQPQKIFCVYQFVNLVTSQINFEVHVTKNNFDLVKFRLVILVDGTPLGLKRLIVDLLYHLEAFLSSFNSFASLKMAV